MFINVLDKVLTSTNFINFFFKLSKYLKNFQWSIQIIELVQSCDLLNQQDCFTYFLLGISYSRFYFFIIIFKFLIFLHTCVLFLEAILKYKSKNGVLPTSLVIFRDGVGEGQISQVHKTEVKLLKVGIFFEVK